MARRFSVPERGRAALPVADTGDATLTKRIEVPEGAHTVTVDALDVAGNRRAATHSTHQYDFSVTPRSSRAWRSTRRGDRFGVSVKGRSIAWVSTTGPRQAAQVVWTTTISRCHSSPVTVVNASPAAGASVTVDALLLQR